jgi:acyl carrier protein
MNPIQDRVRQLLKEQGTVQTGGLTDATDLYAAGLTSLATVDLMMAIEQAFDLVLPDEALHRRTFASIGSIAAVIESLQPGPPP